MICFRFSNYDGFLFPAGPRYQATGPDSRKWLAQPSDTDLTWMDDQQVSSQICFFWISRERSPYLQLTLSDSYYLG